MSYLCSKCGSELPEDALFCSKCGEKVAGLRCTSCGKRLLEDSEFCTYCGAKISADNTSQPVESLNNEAPDDSKNSTHKEGQSEHLVPEEKNLQTDAEEVSSSQEECEASSNVNGTSMESELSPHTSGTADLYAKLKACNAEGKKDTTEYRYLLKKEKSAYFWIKLFGFLCIIWFNACTYFVLGSYAILAKLVILFGAPIILGILYIPICHRINKITGIKIIPSLSSIFSDKESKEEEQEADRGSTYFFESLNEQHRKTFHVLKIVSIVVIGLSALYFVLCLTMGLGVWASFYQAVNLWAEILLIITAVWTFKWAIVALVIVFAFITALLISKSNGSFSEMLSDKLGLANFQFLDRDKITADANDYAIKLRCYEAATDAILSDPSYISTLHFYDYEDGSPLSEVSLTDSSNETGKRSAIVTAAADYTYDEFYDESQGTSGPIFRWYFTATVDIDTSQQGDPVISVVNYSPLDGRSYVLDDAGNEVPADEWLAANNNRTNWDYDDYVSYYGFDPADYGYEWYNEIRNGPLDEFFEMVYQELSNAGNNSRLYTITDPYSATLTPDDFVGRWVTNGGIVFTIEYYNGEYSIDFTENNNLSILGGWFSENTYNIEGAFSGMAGSTGVTSFSVSYEYGTDYPTHTWLTLDITESDGNEIIDYVSLT